MLINMTSFQSLGLGSDILKSVHALGLHQPTSIQCAAIAAALRGADVLGIAPTGSGKTLAYCLPLLQQLEKSTKHSPLRVQSLVLVPTRELAAQVGEVLRSAAEHLDYKVKVAVVFGGLSINPQMMALRGGADILVATPGRLIDLFERNAVKVSSVQTLVLDEADRLLDLGFAEEVSKLLSLLPPKRQNLFFSATFGRDVSDWATLLLHQPERIDVATADKAHSDPESKAVFIEQRAIDVDAIQRTQLLVKLVRDNAWSSALVFVATKYAAEYVAMKLQRAKIYATAFHGDLSQGARTEVLDGLKAGGWQVVVTTDLAARGIDIDKLPVVINFDLPRSATDYIHRIGRTGRAGAAGLAISFVSKASDAHFRLIEKRQGLTVPREIIDGFAPKDEAPVLLDKHGGIKGRRPSKKDKLRAKLSQELSTVLSAVLSKELIHKPGEAPSDDTSTKLS
jgi:ATP-dependent RNA helicase RhlE